MFLLQAVRIAPFAIAHEFDFEVCSVFSKQNRGKSF